MEIKWNFLEMLLCQNYARNFIAKNVTMERVKKVATPIICHPLNMHSVSVEIKWNY